MRYRHLVRLVRRHELISKKVEMSIVVQYEETFIYETIVSKKNKRSQWQLMATDACSGIGGCISYEKIGGPGLQKINIFISCFFITLPF